MKGKICIVYIYECMQICEVTDSFCYVYCLFILAGTVVVTENQALLWTDGRYYLQAAEEIDSNWILMKAGLPDTPSQAEWLNTNLPSGSRVGVDPFLYSIDEWTRMSNELHTGGKILTAVRANLIDAIWPSRPSRPQEKVKVLNLEFSGKSSVEKLNDVRNEMKGAGAEALVVSELDEIACKISLIYH